MNKILIIVLVIALGACKSEKQKQMEAIQANEKKLFGDTSKMLDQKIALTQIESYKKYVESYSEDSLSPQYLFKAADLAHGMRKSQEALDLYNEFLSKYPTHPKAAASLFLIAFIYDNDLHQKDTAKLKYKEFLEKYPAHQLAPSAKAALDQLEMGLSDEDLVKLFEERQDSAKKASN
jgi:outer membrane protein assembly factor BamD (BamD/ComL family)